MTSPTYPALWGMAGRLALAMLCRRSRSFRTDSRYCIAQLKPPLRVYGKENIPPHGSYLVTVNHYSRPGFRAWWFALAISAVLHGEVHWVVTEAWTYADALRSHLVTPATRVLFRRAARVYGFTNMPPMPPRPGETQARALAVRKVIRYAHQAAQPVIGLAPEGGDAEGGRLVHPPAGVGRFISHLTCLGLSILPVGAFEEGDRFCLQFGAAYGLETPVDLSPEGRDQYASAEVMTRIAACLPDALRGDFRSPDLIEE